MRFFLRISACCFVFILSATLLLAFAPPEKGRVKDNFDLRAKMPSGVLKFKRASFTRGQEEALKKLNVSLGGRLHYELNPIGGIPRQMFKEGGPLTGPDPRDPVTIARTFLKARKEIFLFSDAAIDEMTVIKNYRTQHTGMRTVWLNQMYQGIPVFEGSIRFAIDRHGRVWWVDTSLARPAIKNMAEPSIGSAKAVELAAADAGYPLQRPVNGKTPLADHRQVFDGGPYFVSDPAAVLFVYTTGEGARFCWAVTLEFNSMEWYQTLVDAADGEILSRVNLVQFARDGLVFNCEHPDTWNDDGRGCAQTVEPFVETPYSHDGWLLLPPFVGTLQLINQRTGAVYTIPADYQWTQGNNVDVKEDLASDNERNIGAHADGGPSQEFRFPFNDYYGTTCDTAMAEQDLNASQTNVFYWVNKIHDYYYSLGFDEAAGNFQEDSFGLGGQGFDPILADAFDGGGMDNASFGTPDDGYAPRLTLYLWDGGNACADCSYDAGVIMHELTHGLSTRLIGGPGTSWCLGVGPQGGGISEGLSDFMPATYFDDPVMGAYVWGDVNGIRLYPYDAYPRTYENICEFTSWFPPSGCESHYDGEIFAAFLWDYKEAVADPLVATQIVVDAMKLAPCPPTWVDFRDSMLLADQIAYGGAHACDIWNAAAKRGLGFQAKAGQYEQDPQFAVVDFNTHPSCAGTGYPAYQASAADDAAGGNGDGVPAPGETIALTVTLNNLLGAAPATSVTATLSTTTPNVTMVTDVASYPAIAVGGTADSVTPYVFSLSPGYPCGVPIEFTIDIQWGGTYQKSEKFQVAVGTGGSTVWIDDAESGGVFTMGGDWSVSGAENHSPSGGFSYYTGTGVDGACDQLLSPPLPVPYAGSYQGVELAFFLRYNLEYCWDGLVVEVSDDYGITWNSLDVGYNARFADNSGCGFPYKHPSISGPPDNSGLTGWTLFRGDLTSYMGKTILVRFTYSSDGSYTVDGAYLDDIEIRTTTCRGGTHPGATLTDQTMNDTLAAGCTDSDGVADPGEQIDYTVTIMNTGTGPSLNTQGTLSTTNPNVIGINMGPVSFGDINPGASASATFSFSVAPDPAVACLEPADMQLALTANGGADVYQVDYPIVLRADWFNNGGTPGVYQDDFNMGLPAWTAAPGPDGTMQDWRTWQFNVDCISPAGTLFWATNPAIDPDNCGTGEPDYSADSDSVLTSPPIDLGAPNETLTRLSWHSFFASWSGYYPNLQVDGFSQVLIDHDGDGVFTPLLTVNNGLNDIMEVDIQNNPEGNPIDPLVTSQFVQVQFRFRTIGADPGPTTDSLGWSLGAVSLEYHDTEKYVCDILPCAPGVRRSLNMQRRNTSSVLFNSGNPASLK